MYQLQAGIYSNRKQLQTAGEVGGVRSCHKINFTQIRLKSMSWPRKETSLKKRESILNGMQNKLAL